jgi:DNA-binding response OmpR family regulator
MNKILIIDDDPDLCTLVSIILERDGYQVESAYDGSSGVEIAARTRPDLILLDIMMPGDSGWDVCEQLRRTGDAPIIFLSARESEGDVVRGLRLGAEDYISKPFRRHELAARIEAVLRRSQRARPTEDTVYEIGDLVIDQTRWDVQCAGEPVHLTPTEFRLLLLLAQHAGRPVSHKEILTTVWGAGKDDNLNLLKVYVRQLRRKIEPDPDRPRYILTKRGIGYCLSP